MRKNDQTHEASVYDRLTVPAPQVGWYRYTFADWSALAIMLPPDTDGDAQSVIALPPGKQDAWLAFLLELKQLHQEILHQDKKGRVEVLGGFRYSEQVIRQTTFDEVILPEEVLEQVRAQFCIFTSEVLTRYERFHISRLRKALLLGPPGTGKTTLLKALAAQHAREGGYVLYVMTSKKADLSWESLSAALHTAAANALPTLVIAEDFEQFVSNHEDMQRILNMLDGVATPDNPAGTLLLATTNDPEQIDRRIKDRPGRIDSLIEIGVLEDEALVCRFLQRFLQDLYVAEEHDSFAGALLQQTGSHIREVCLLATINALRESHSQVMRSDLEFAHERILAGREKAAQPERCDPPAPRRRTSFFGKR